MIIIKLQAGLGNQMFQYAFGRALEERLKAASQSPTEAFVKFDLNYYLNTEYGHIDTPRTYALDKFNTKVISATPEEVFALNPVFKRYFVKAKNKILTAFNKRNPYKFDEKEFAVKDNSYLLGYWQTEKYFKNISEKIREEFTLKNPFSGKSAEAYGKISATTNTTISIHIRRSDYVSMLVNNKFFGTCSHEYYENAFAKMNEILSSKSNKDGNSDKKSIELFVFSDDIAWAKENLKFPCPMNFVSCPEIPDYEELILMSKCKHNIIANSTFSWWGAWLNQNPDKIVIAPKKWLAKSSVDTSDVVPETWIKI